MPKPWGLQGVDFLLTLNPAGGFSLIFNRKRLPSCRQILPGMGQAKQRRYRQAGRSKASGNWKALVQAYVAGRVFFAGGFVGRVQGKAGDDGDDHGGDGAGQK